MDISILFTYFMCTEEEEEEESLYHKVLNTGTGVGAAVGIGLSAVSFKAVGVSIAKVVTAKGGILAV